MWQIALILFVFWSLRIKVGNLFDFSLSYGPYQERPLCLFCFVMSPETSLLWSMTKFDWFVSQFFPVTGSSSHAENCRTKKGRALVCQETAKSPGTSQIQNSLGLSARRDAMVGSRLLSGKKVEESGRQKGLTFRLLFIASNLWRR